MKSRRSRFALSLALSGAALVATSGLAYAGALPGAAQDTAKGVLAGLGVTVPGRTGMPDASRHPRKLRRRAQQPPAPVGCDRRHRLWQGQGSRHLDPGADRPRPAVTRARPSPPPPAAEEPRRNPPGQASGDQSTVPPIRAEPVLPMAPAVDMTARVVDGTNRQRRPQRRRFRQRRQPPPLTSQHAQPRSRHRQARRGRAWKVGGAHGGVT